MRRGMVLWTLVVLLASAGPVLAADELTAGEKLAVESLIRQFSQRSFADRQKATERLIEIGPKVLPMVQQALAGATDNEVKLRCRMVMDGIAKQYGVQVEAPQATGTTTVVPGKLDFEASKVTINAKGSLLDEILQQFADKSGNRVIAMPENWQGGPIDFAVTDMPYWQALDKLCTQLKLACTPDFRSGTLRLAPAEKPSEINAYTGPVVVRVESATKRRTFGSVDGGRQPRDGLFYQLTYAWEDRIRPLRSEVTIARATGADGKALKLDETPAFRGMGMGMGRPGAAAGSTTVSFVDVPAGLERLSLVEGAVKMSFGDGRKQVRINDVFGEGERKVVDGDATLTVTRANRARGGAFVVLNQTVKGEETPIPGYPADSGYGFSLVAPDGKEYRSSAGFGGFGGPGGFQRGPGGAPPGQPQDNDGGRNRFRRDRGGNPRDRDNRDNAAIEDDPVEAVIIEVQNVPPDDQDNDDNQDRGGRRGGRRGGDAGGFMMRRGTSVAAFRNLPDVEGQWTLVYTRPQNETEKTFPFTLKDVPLP